MLAGALTHLHPPDCLECPAVYFICTVCVLYMYCPVYCQAENERSFKLLQEYIHQARSGDARSPAARVPYRFEFYLHAAAPASAERKHSDEAGTKSDDDASRARQGVQSQTDSKTDHKQMHELRKVEVTLPPPITPIKGVRAFGCCLFVLLAHLHGHFHLLGSLSSAVRRWRGGASMHPLLCRHCNVFIQHLIIYSITPPP